MSILRTIKLFLLAALAVWFVVFAAGNHDPVQVSLFPLPYEISLPEFMFAIVCFVGGVLVTTVALGLKNSHERIQFRQERKKSAALQEELQLVKAKKSALPSIQSTTF